MAQVNQTVVEEIETTAQTSDIDLRKVPEVISTQNEERDSWGKSIEFLFSCIAMSVGLGNIWRFPFAALKHGGGAFIIPYLIVLFLVGRPIYFMEMVIGQFSSRGTIKIYDLSPGMRGIGVGQVISTFCVSTYYATVLAISLRYFVESFKSVLPWAICDSSWTDFICQPSGESEPVVSVNSSLPKVTSATLYFVKEVTQEKSSIDDGIGAPIGNLVGFLAFSWILIFFIMIKGIRSSGKAMYFLAIFPYFVLIVLFIRTATLPGAWNGIAHLFNPRWKEMLNYRVWFDAVTQVFFSLNICFGAVSMYSSYNKFNHNLYRDVNIISVLDTFTSLLAATITFGVLGHAEYKTGEDVYSTALGGPGLIFITYPDALAKFEFLPQLFSVIFFLMLYTLGIGSIISMISCVMTVIRDQFPKVKNWQAALIGSCAAFVVGIIYLTPGGMQILTIVDFFAAQWVAFIFAIAELFAVFYIYGTDRFCRDIEFMLGFQPGIYWRACWKVITPATMISIFIYTLFEFKIIKYNDEFFPTGVYVFGWCLTGLCLVQLPIFVVISIYSQRQFSFWNKVKSAFRPLVIWGPKNLLWKDRYDNYILRNSKYNL